MSAPDPAPERRERDAFGTFGDRTERQLWLRAEPSEDVVWIFQGGVLEEQRLADLGEARRILIQQPETLESAVSNPHDTKRLASPRLAKYPAGPPTLDRGQVVVPHQILDEAFNRS
mgnify:CR=1 FL=1